MYVVCLILAFGGKTVVVYGNGVLDSNCKCLTFFSSGSLRVCFLRSLNYLIYYY